MNKKYQKEIKIQKNYFNINWKKRINILISDLTIKNEEGIKIIFNYKRITMEFFIANKDLDRDMNKIFIMFRNIFEERITNHGFKMANTA